jgi:ATP-binding cassette, subfamily B, bacterial
LSSFWILEYLRFYRKNIAVLALLSLAEIALRLLTPWPMQAIVDYAFGSSALPPWLKLGGKQQLLVAIVAAGLIIQLAHYFIMMLHTRLQVATGQQMLRDLRERMFAHLQGLALTHHAKTPIGDSVYRLEADALCLDQLVFGGLFPLTFSLVTLVVMFGVLVSINLKLALISMLVVPPMYLWLRLYTRRIAPRVDQTKQLDAKLSARLHESFSAIRLIKSFARESFEHGRFAGAAGQAMKANIDLGERESMFSVVIGTLTVVGNAFVLGAGGMAVIRGELTLGTLLVIITYLAYVYGPLSAMALTTGNLQRALSSARRVRELMALMPESTDAPDSIKMGATTGAVYFEDVSFAYESGYPVLANVTFTALAGETIALVGPSGAGKTTLVSLIPRFYELTSGRILIDGVDVRHYTMRSLREQTAVVHQEAMTMSGSVRENLQYGHLEASDEHIYAAAIAANAHAFIEQLPLGYDTNLGEAGAGLSGGQKQRISIARAFLKNAPILILDEPTAALDTISEVQVLEALRRLRSGRTTFVIAHRLSTIREADRILVMDGGRIVAEGTDAELLKTSPLYRQLCRKLEGSREEEPVFAG